MSLASMSEAFQHTKEIALRMISAQGATPEHRIILCLAEVVDDLPRPIQICFPPRPRSTPFDLSCIFHLTTEVLHHKELSKTMTNPLIVYPCDPSGSSDLSLAIDTEVSGLEGLLPEVDDDGKTRNALMAIYDRTLKSGFFDFIKTIEGVSAIDETDALGLKQDEESIDRRLTSWQNTVQGLEALINETTESWKKLMPDHGKKSRTVYDRGGAPASKAERSVLLSAFSCWLLDKVLSLSQDHLKWTDHILSSSNSQWIRSKQDLNRAKRETEDRLERERADAHTPSRLLLNAVSYPFRRLSFGNQSSTTPEGDELQENDSDRVEEAKRAEEEAVYEYRRVREAYFGVNNRDENGNCADLTRIVTLLRSAEAMSKEMEEFKALVKGLEAERAKHTYIETFLDRVSAGMEKLAQDLQSIKATSVELVDDRSDRSGYWMSTNPTSRDLQPKLDQALHSDQPFSPRTHEEQYVSGAGTEPTGDDGSDARSESGDVDEDRKEEDKHPKDHKRQNEGDDIRLDSWTMTPEDATNLSSEEWREVDRQKYHNCISHMDTSLKNLDPRRGLRTGNRTHHTRRVWPFPTRYPSPGIRGSRRKSHTGTVDAKWLERMSSPPPHCLTPLATLQIDTNHNDRLVDASPVSAEMSPWTKTRSDILYDPKEDVTDLNSERTKTISRAGFLEILRGKDEQPNDAFWLAQRYETSPLSSTDQIFRDALTVHLDEVLQPRDPANDVFTARVPYYPRSAISFLRTLSGGQDDLNIGSDRPKVPPSAGVRGQRRFSVTDTKALSRAIDWTIEQAIEVAQTTQQDLDETEEGSDAIGLSGVLVTTPSW